MDVTEHSLPYDATSRDSILKHAQKLLGKTLRELYPSILQKQKGKGAFGQLVEQFHFLYSPNSNDEPDFPIAGVELKCTPLKLLKDGSMVSKERLVLNIINYLNEAEKCFENSSFMHKNSLLLLIFYLHLELHDKLDFPVKITRLWTIPEEDLKIFMDDWNVIHDKIATGHAHELSEGDTLYLAACVKGSKGGANKRKQSVGDILADQRAFSIKSSYLNFIILESLDHPQMCDGLILTERQKEIIQTHRKEYGSVPKDQLDYHKNESF